jgi:DNA-directed RNA polymerase subunit RPC12/RpoP
MLKLTHELDSLKTAIENHNDVESNRYTFDSEDAYGVEFERTLEVVQKYSVRYAVLASNGLLGAEYICDECSVGFPISQMAKHQYPSDFAGTEPESEYRCTKCHKNSIE